MKMNLLKNLKKNMIKRSISYKVYAKVWKNNLRINGNSILNFNKIQQMLFSEIQVINNKFSNTKFSKTCIC